MIEFHEVKIHKRRKALSNFRAHPRGKHGAGECGADLLSKRWPSIETAHWCTPTRIKRGWRAWAETRGESPGRAGRPDLFVRDNPCLSAARNCGFALLPTTLHVIPAKTPPTTAPDHILRCLWAITTERTGRKGKTRSSVHDKNRMKTTAQVAVAVAMPWRSLHSRT